MSLNTLPVFSTEEFCKLKTIELRVIEQAEIKMPYERTSTVYYVIGKIDKDLIAVVECTEDSAEWLFHALIPTGIIKYIGIELMVNYQTIKNVLKMYEEANQTENEQSVNEAFTQKQSAIS